MLQYQQTTYETVSEIKQLYSSLWTLFMAVKKLRLAFQ